MLYHVYSYVNIQFWFCKWCHKLWGSETQKPINRVMRKQDCRSLHCYLTFALTIKHFRNKQAMDPRLRKLQADSKSSCLILHHQSSCTGSTVLLPPLTLAPKITHACLPCGESGVDRAITPSGCPRYTSLSVLFFPKADSLNAAWDVTCPFPVEGNCHRTKCRSSLNWRVHCSWT